MNLRFYQILSAIVILLSIFSSADGSGYSICFFYNVTSLPCPGCGLTRSSISILQGKFIEALLYNPFGIFAVPAVIFFTFTIFIKKLESLFIKYENIFNKIFLVVASFLFLYGMIRILFVYLYPESEYFHKFSEPALLHQLLHFL